VPVQVKAWVAASAMQAAPVQLKPQQQTQQLLGLAIPMALPHPNVRLSNTQQLTDEAKEATEANEVKEVAEDTVKTVAENAEHEAELQASVQEQGKMLKKLMGNGGAAAIREEARQGQGCRCTLECREPA
jgi:hypothetical protein